MKVSAMSKKGAQTRGLRVRTHSPWMDAIWFVGWIPILVGPFVVHRIHGASVFATLSATFLIGGGVLLYRTVSLETMGPELVIGRHRLAPGEVNDIHFTAATQRATIQLMRRQMWRKRWVLRVEKKDLAALREVLRRWAEAHGVRFVLHSDPVHGWTTEENG